MRPDKEEDYQEISTEAALIVACWTAARTRRTVRSSEINPAAGACTSRLDCEALEPTVVDGELIAGRTVPKAPLSRR